MRALGAERWAGPIWLDCGLRRSAALAVRGRAVQVLVWRLAVGWRGAGTIGGAVVWPLAVVERRGGQVRWRPVPDPTLFVAVLALALAAWSARGRRRAAPRRGPRG
ncbi:MAG TPA: hypothetical protein VK066_15450 [Chloroflexota bacterium]|nr:hypothetical protein [Chloroflexota bacterium]